MPIIDMSALDVITPNGRPTLAVCIDAHSRMVVGCAFFFEPPSVRCALPALEKCLQTPVALTERVNLQLSK